MCRPTQPACGKAAGAIDVGCADQELLALIRHDVQCRTAALLDLQTLRTSRRCMSKRILA